MYFRSVLGLGFSRGGAGGGEADEEPFSSSDFKFTLHIFSE
jgi:hypothetical protein